MEKKPFYQPPKADAIEGIIIQGGALCASLSQSDFENVEYVDSGIEL